MRRIILCLSTIAAAVLLLYAFIHSAPVHADDASVSYPDGYRNWTFLHGSVVSPSFPGFSKPPCVKPCTNGIFYFYAKEGKKECLPSKVAAFNTNHPLCIT